MKYYSLVFIVLSLVSCADRTGSDPEKTVFRFNEASGITSLDPAFAKDQATIWPCLQLYNGLVQLDSSLQVKPAIAGSWTISDSGKTYTFFLRDDVYFHDNELFKASNRDQTSAGRKVIAQDFVFSLNRLVDPRIASPGSWVLNAVERDETGNLSGISALNDSILRIRLSHPFPAFLSLLSMPYCSVLPHEVVQHYGQDFRTHPCGTGPFRFSFWKEGVSLILLKNENYFEWAEGQRLPYLDAIQISFINDKQSAFIEFLKGNLDFLSGLDASYKDELLTRDGMLQERHRNKFRLQTLPYLNTEYLGVLIRDTSTTSLNVLQKKQIRQALSMGFDKVKMMTFLRNNMGTPGIYGFLPPGLPHLKPADYGYAYYPVKAAQLMEAAGFPGGKGLPSITLSTTSSYLDLCEYIKSEWEALGFKINIDVNQAAIHRKMVAEQKLDFFRGSWIADYPDAENYLSLFYSGNKAPAGPNYTHYENPEYDSLYKSSFAISDDSSRSVIYHALDKLIIEDAVVIVLYYDKVLRLTRNNILDLENNAMNMLVLKNVRKINAP